MSLSPEAIKELQKPALAELITGKVEKAMTTGGDNMPATLIPDGFNMKSLEGYMPGRFRMRGKFETDSTDAFIRYIGERRTDSPASITHCFVRKDPLAATGIFNLGTEQEPGHCDDTAKLAIEASPLWAALQKINGVPQSQKEMAEFLEDWTAECQPIDQQGDPMSVAQAISALRKVKISAIAESEHNDRDFGASVNSFQEIEADADKKQAAEFHFSCTPYEGLQDRDITMRLSIHTGGNAPALKLRIMQLDKTKEGIALEFVEKMQSELPDGTRVHIGAYNLK